ncbi:MAG: hypothetical protein QOF98_2526, partial [Streptomyces sp.]|nr:hypothetical protein [Streptomyces sp.]
MTCGTSRRNAEGNPDMNDTRRSWLRASWFRTVPLRLVGGAAAAVLVGSALGYSAPAASAGGVPWPHAPSVTVERGGPARTLPFVAHRSGEAVVTLNSQAAGVSWGTAGSESAVVSAYVDGRYATDIVIPSDQPVARSFSLGHLTKGPHTLWFRFAADRSPQGASSARLGDASVQVYADSSDLGLVLQNAPVLYGRKLADLGTEFQSSTTDTPLFEYHEFLPATTPGHRVIQYTVIWSNEDGGTDSP